MNYCQRLVNRKSGTCTHTWSGGGGVGEGWVIISLVLMSQPISVLSVAQAWCCGIGVIQRQMSAAVETMPGTSEQVTHAATAQGNHGPTATQKYLATLF